MPTTALYDYFMMPAGQPTTGAIESNVGAEFVYYPESNLPTVLGPLYVPRVYGKDLTALELASSGLIAISLKDTHSFDLDREVATSNVTLKTVGQDSFEIGVNSDRMGLQFGATGGADEVTLYTDSNMFISASNQLKVESKSLLQTVQEDATVNAKNLFVNGGSNVEVDTAKYLYLHSDSNARLCAASNLYVNTCEPGGSVWIEGTQMTLGASNLDASASNMTLTAADTMSLTAPNFVYNFQNISYLGTNIATAGNSVTLEAPGAYVSITQSNIQMGSSNVLGVTASNLSASACNLQLFAADDACLKSTNAEVCVKPNQTRVTGSNLVEITSATLIKNDAKAISETSALINIMEVVNGGDGIVFDKAALSSDPILSLKVLNVGSQFEIMTNDGNWTRSATVTSTSYLDSWGGDQSKAFLAFNAPISGITLGTGQFWLVAVNLPSGFYTTIDPTNGFKLHDTYNNHLLVDVKDGHSLISSYGNSSTTGLYSTGTNSGIYLTPDGDGSKLEIETPASITDTSYVKVFTASNIMNICQKLDNSFAFEQVIDAAGEKTMIAGVSDTKVNGMFSVAASNDVGLSAGDVLTASACNEILLQTDAAYFKVTPSNLEGMTASTTNFRAKYFMVQDPVTNTTLVDISGNNSTIRTDWIDNSQLGIYANGNSSELKLSAPSANSTIILETDAATGTMSNLVGAERTQVAMNFATGAVTFDQVIDSTGVRSKNLGSNDTLVEGKYSVASSNDISLVAGKDMVLDSGSNVRLSAASNYSLVAKGSATEHVGGSYTVAASNAVSVASAGGDATFKGASNVYLKARNEAMYVQLAEESGSNVVSGNADAYKWKVAGVDMVTVNGDGLNIAGNIKVLGSIDTINVTQSNLQVQDKKVVLAYSEAAITDGAANDLSGIVVQGEAGKADKSLVWRHNQGTDYLGTADLDKESYWEMKGGSFRMSHSNATLGGEISFSFRINQLGEMELVKKTPSGEYKRVAKFGRTLM